MGHRSACTLNISSPQHCCCRYIVTDGVGRMGMKKAWQILEEFMRVRAVRSARFPLACQVGQARREAPSAQMQ
jgi:hypothetical protein